MKTDSTLYQFLKFKGVEFHYEKGLAYPVDPFVHYEYLDEYVQWLYDNREI